MKLLEKSFLMICMTALLSFAIFLTNDNHASAMSLSDLQGTYRIVDSDTTQLGGQHSKGGVVELKYIDGELVGIGKNSPSNGDGFSAGAKVIYDVWVDAGVIHCKASYSVAIDRKDSILQVYDNGNTLKVSHKAGLEYFWIMKKTN